MLLFVPLALLVVTFLALVAGNWLERGFRSNWLLALGGSAAAWLSLLVLRLQLPLSFSFPTWWAGDSQVFSSSFVLDEVSWPLAFALCSLVLAGHLGQVRQAMSAGWRSWASGLALASASLLAVLAGDLITLVFTWTLLDVLLFALLLSHLPHGEQRRAALFALPLHLASTFILLSAWTLSFYGSELNTILVFLAAGLRLGFLAPSRIFANHSELRQDFATLLRLAPLPPTLVLLARLQPLAEPARSILLFSILLPAVYAAIQWFRARDGEQKLAYWELGLAGLAGAAALLGDVRAVLAFGLALLLGGGMLVAVQNPGRLRTPLAGLGSLLLCGLPFTASSWASGIYANPSSPLPFIFLLVQALLLAGWVRIAASSHPEPMPPEPWMRAIQSLGLILLPAVYIVFGLGLLPSFAVDPSVVPWWPAVAVLVLAALVTVVARRRMLTLPARYASISDSVFSMRWFSIVESWFERATSWALHFINRLLEGQAGVLWAILLIALLLSLVAQYVVAG